MKTIVRLLKSTPVTLLVLVLFVGYITSCNDDDDDPGSVVNVAYKANFTKSANEVETSATGTATAMFNPSTLELSYSATWSGLGSNAVNMHFHNAGPVMADIPGFPTATGGTVSGKVTLTSAQASDLAAGKIYIQIHTANYPAGEVIATLTKSSSGGSGGGGGGGNGY